MNRHRGVIAATALSATLAVAFTVAVAGPAARASAPVSVIDAALRVRMHYYRASGAVNAGRYRLRANDRPVSLPASLAGDVLGVTGLDNAAPTMTYARPGGMKASPRRAATTGP